MPGWESCKFAGLDKQPKSVGAMVAVKCSQNPFYLKILAIFSRENNIIKCIKHLFAMFRLV